MLSDINNWDLIPLDVYKNILEEAKIRYNEMLSQSENITDKVIKNLLAMSALIAWFVSFLTSTEFEYKNYVIFFSSILTLILFVSIFLVILPRRIVLKGTAPKDSLKNELDFSGDVGGDNYSDDQKIKVYYYHQVNRYQNRIQNLKSTYSARVIAYKFALGISIVFFILMVFVFMLVRL